MKQSPYGYVLLRDQLEGDGDLQDWEPIFIITQHLAEHNNTTIEEDIRRQIAWQVETCGDKPEILAVVEITEPRGIFGKFKKEISYTDITFGEK